MADSDEAATNGGPGATGSGGGSGGGSDSGSGATVSLHVLGNGDGAPSKARRSTMGKWRAAVLIGVHVLIAIHVIQWLITGRTISPVEPSESMQWAQRGIVNAGLIFFALALLSTLVFGRFFCGWACHVVALQDLCYTMMRRIGIRPKPFRSRLLVFVPFILAFYMFLWPAVYRWGLVPLSTTANQWASWIPNLTAPPWPGTRMELTTTDFWATFPGLFVAIPFFLVCGFACVYFLGAKGFCTYGCPYGGFFAPLDQYAPGRIKVNEDCDQTGHCTAVCTSNVRVHDEVREYGTVVDPGCMKCMDCVSVCPNNALSFGFTRPAAIKRPATNADPPRRYDLTWPEEIGCALLFAGTFVAVRGVYALIPMLMAAGIAAVVTFLGWKAYRTFRDPNASFHRFRLRRGGRTLPAGHGFRLVAFVVLALVVHSGVIQIIRLAADRADGRVLVAREQIFSASPVRLPEEMAAARDTALARYQLVQPFWRGGLGLAPWAGVDVRMSWLTACRLEFSEAAELMRREIETSGSTDGRAFDVLALHRLAVEEDAADAWGRTVLAERPEHFRTVQGWASLLLEQGRLDEAMDAIDARIASWEAEHGPAADDDGDGAVALQLLRVQSLVLLEAQRYDAGIAVIERTLEIDPDNPAAWTVYARALAQTRRMTEAVDAAMRSFELAPEPKPAATAALAAQLLDQAGRPFEAEAWRQRAQALEGAAREAVMSGNRGGAGAAPPPAPGPTGAPAP